MNHYHRLMKKRGGGGGKQNYEREKRYGKGIKKADSSIRVPVAYYRACAGNVVWGGGGRRYLKTSKNKTPKL